MRKINFILEKAGDKLGIDIPYYVESGFWVSFGQIIQLIVGALLVLVIARFTTEEVFGHYNFLLTVLSIASLITVPGLNISLLKEISQGRDGTYFKSTKLTFLWSLIGIPILLLAGLYYFFFDEKIIGIGIIVLALFLPFVYSFKMWDPLYQGQKKFKQLSLYSSLKIIISSVFIAASVFIGKRQLMPIFLTYLAVNSFIEISFFLISRKHLRNNEFDINWKKTGYKLTIISVLSVIYDYMDKLIIGVLFEPERLAIYSIAVALTIYLRMAVKMIIRVVTPKIFAADNALLKRVFKKYNLKFFLFLTLITAMMYFSLPFLIRLLYSVKYESSIVYAQIYLFCIPASGLVIYFQQFFIAYNAENQLIKVRIINSVINFAMYLILIPLFEIWGAIFASIFYFYSGAGIYWFLIKRKQKLQVA